jgi:predicted SnoaL-like aldol condensation-catalyzing enzyme
MRASKEASGNESFDKLAKNLTQQRSEIVMTKNDSRIISHKNAAISFLHLVVAGKIKEAYETYVRQDMLHHNTAFAGDAASLEKAMEENYSQFPHKIIDDKHALEDGGFVTVHSHVRVRAEDPGFAVVHLFRFQDDHIVEMWDIGQAVPENSPNENGMF